MLEFPVKSDSMPHPILLYDGVCGLCNRLVQFILRRDGAGVFRFASLQSALAAGILGRHGADARDLNTVYVVVNYELPDERLLARSDAVIFVLKQLSAAAELRSARPGLRPGPTHATSAPGPTHATSTPEPTQATPTPGPAQAAELRSAGQPGAAVPTRTTTGRPLWRLVAFVPQVVPKPLRDWGYRLVARH